MDEKTKKKNLTAFVKELKAIKGRHTELVSVYVPAGFNLSKVAEQLRQEQSTAQNIKSKQVKNNVLSALEKILSHLKFYKKTPDMGMAIFAGNISEKEGSTNIQLFHLEHPIEPINVRLYRCDQKFILEPLEEQVEEKEIYGLIMVDKSDAEIGLLRGKRIEPIKHMDSIVPGKTEAGGWSQHRYERVREGLLQDFLKKVADVANHQFRDIKTLQGVIIGGPGPIKEQFIREEHLDHNLRKNIIGPINTSYTGEYGLKEMVNRSEDLLKEASAIKEKKLLDEYFEELGKQTGLATYGLEKTVKALDAGAVKILLISEKFEWKVAGFVCKRCGNKEQKILDHGFLEQTCEKCEEKLTVETKKEIVEDIIEKADDFGTTVELISPDTPQGKQLQEIGAIGAILRYKV